ncbi:Tripartite motif-containing protein 59 [Aphelenchoides avenae]|nr:Tripartite motif-containing protein 59 [Aphelenchus avenae]
MVPTSTSYTESLKCTVCLEMYRDPLTLPACGHSVCSACVQQLIANTHSPNNVVCPECRVHSPVPTNGFPRNYRLAGIIATLEAAGYRDTSQCSCCRSLVPNRRLRECVTCAKEGSLLLCADCALRRHKNHYLVQFRRPPPPVPGNSSVRVVTPTLVTVDERTPVLENGERERQRTVRTHRQPAVDDGQRRRYERNQSRERYGRIKAAILAVIKYVIFFLCLAATGFLVGIFFHSVGPIKALWLCVLVVAFGLVIYVVGAWCHSFYQN